MAQIDKNSELQAFQAGPGVSVKDRALSLPGRLLNHKHLLMVSMDASPLLSSSEVPTLESSTVGITAIPKCTSCFPAKHTDLRSWCTLKESEVELKDVTSVSFEIKEQQTWLGQCPYTKGPHIPWKTRMSEAGTPSCTLCPSQHCPYRVTSPGPRELKQRGHWDEDE